MADDSRPPLDSFMKRPPLSAFHTGNAPSEKVASGTVPVSEGQGVFGKLLGIGGPRYQTWPERAARGVYSDIKGAVDAAATSDPGHPEEMVPAVMNAAKDVVPISPASRVARSIPLTGKPSEAAVPTQEELLDAYAPLKDSKTMHIELKPEVLPSLRNDIHEALRTANTPFRDYLAPKTYKAVDELILPKGQKPTVMDIEGVRRLLNNIPDESAAARIAKEKIHDYLSEIPDTDATGKNVGKVLSEIRGNYSAGKKSQMITNAEDKAERGAGRTGSGANLDNKLRQGIDSIINSPKQVRGIPKDILEEMKKVSKGGPVGNLARLLSKMGPKHPVSGWFTALLADLKGGMGAALGTMALGAAGQKIAEKTTLKKIQMIDEALRKQSPMYKGRVDAAAPAMPAATTEAGPLAYRGAAAYIQERRRKEEQEKLARALNKPRYGGPSD